MSDYLRVLSGLDNGIVITVRGTSLGEADAVGSFKLEAIGSILLMDAIVPQDWHKLGAFKRIIYRGDVAGLDGELGGEGHGGHTGEDHLGRKRNR